MPTTDGARQEASFSQLLEKLPATRTILADDGAFMIACSSEIKFKQTLMKVSASGVLRNIDALRNPETLGNDMNHVILCLNGPRHT
jgi:hypothetical protein